MKARTETTTFEGLAGTIDCALDHPAGTPAGWALILHPHPLHGGTRNNKVVTTLARACTDHGLLVVRPDFRGVGASAGEFDHGQGETDDMAALCEQFLASRPELAGKPWVLAGFSFGTSVAAQLGHLRSEAGHSLPDVTVLAGAAVARFSHRPAHVPDDALLVHGEEDDTVPLSEVMAFARPRGLPVTVIPATSHFFHGKLLVLRALVARHLAALL